MIAKVAERLFKFSDGSTGTFPINYRFFGSRPTHMYSSENFGFGEWIKL